MVGLLMSNPARAELMVGYCMMIAIRMLRAVRLPMGRARAGSLVSYLMRLKGA